MHGLVQQRLETSEEALLDAAVTRLGVRCGQHPSPGDPAKVAKAVIDSVDQTPAPTRIALGSDAYGYIHAALTERLATLETQKDLAFSTDFPAGR